MLLQDPGRTAATWSISLFRNGPVPARLCGVDAVVGAEVTGAMERLELNEALSSLVLLPKLLLFLVMLATFKQDTVSPTKFVTNDFPVLLCRPQCRKLGTLKLLVLPEDIILRLAARLNDGMMGLGADGTQADSGRIPGVLGARTSRGRGRRGIVVVSGVVDNVDSGIASLVGLVRPRVLVRVVPPEPVLKFVVTMAICILLLQVLLRERF